MSVHSTTVFYKWTEAVPHEVVFEQLGHVCERLGLDWFDPPRTIEVCDNCQSELPLPPNKKILLSAIGLEPKNISWRRKRLPISWRYAQDNYSLWIIQWGLKTAGPEMEFRFIADNLGDRPLVRQNGCSGELFWIAVSIDGALMFGGQETEEETSRLKKKYDAFKVLFRMLKCDEAVAAGYFDEGPPEDHRYRYFRLGKTGTQVLTERFESEQIRAMATDSYRGKILLPPESLPHILASVG